MFYKTTLLKGIIIFILAVFITAGVTFFSLGLLEKSTPTSRSGKELVTKKAPSFTGVDLYGKSVSLDDYDENDVVILNFWASWCPPCREETPGMERIWKKYKNDGVLLIGINVQDSLEDTESYVDEFKITFPIVMDMDGSTSIDYGVTGLPVTFLLNSEGRIVDRWVGAISESRLESWILNR